VTKVKFKMVDRQHILAKALRDLAGLQVLIGVPEERTGRKGEGANNAQLAYIHTHGSPVKGIPARPFIQPALEAKENRGPITDVLEQAILSVMGGEGVKAKTFLKKAGMMGQNAVRAWFTNPKNGWEGNTPLTQGKKKSTMPLIDTGQLRKSVVYVVKDGNDG
jgi:hypothetical protein